MGPSYDPRGASARTSSSTGARDDLSDLATAQMPAVSRGGSSDITRQPRGRKAILAGIVAVLLVVTSIYGVKHLLGGTPHVQLYTVQMQTLTGSVGGGGLTQAPPGQEQDVAYPVNGQVVSVAVQLGQTVTKGQTLLTLNAVQLQEQLQQAYQVYQSAQQYLNNLIAGGQAYSLIAQAQQAVANDLAAYQNLNALLHSPSYNNGKITSMYDGQVTALNVQPGSLFYANAVLVTVNDLSTVLVTAQFPLEDSDLVKIGQQAQVDPIATTNQTAAGTVTGISHVVSTPGSGTFPVYITVPNQSGLLSIGESVYASVTSQQQFPTVPELAVINPGSDSIVFVYSNGRAHLRRVAVALRDGDKIGISNGLQPGDQVILVGQYQLSDNEPVIVSNG